MMFFNPETATLVWRFKEKKTFCKARTSEERIMSRLTLTNFIINEEKRKTEQGSVVSNHKSKPQKAATKAKDNNTHSARFNTFFPRSYSPGCILLHV